MLDRALRIAAAERTVTAVIIPSDVQELEYAPPGHEFKMVPSSLGVQWPQVTPDDDAVRQAATCSTPVPRSPCSSAPARAAPRPSCEEVADLLGAGVAKALLGKDVLSDELPWVTGSIGLLGTRPSYELMKGCDTLLTVGSSFPYTQFMPAFDQARAVQVDVDPKQIGMRYPYEVNLVGDARTTLRALIPLLHRKTDRGWRDEVESSVSRWWETMYAEAMVEADPVNPMRLFAELSPLLPDDVIVTADSGSAANWYARQLKFRGHMRGSLSGNLATMGPGVPYGIGAKFGNPETPVVVFAGDGAMQMNGMAELITIKHYWQQWADPRLVVAVLHNNDLNQVTWEMRAMAGSPKFAESQTLPDVDYAAFASSLGLQGIAVDKPDDLRTAWANALSADRPTVLDVRVDPDVPPIPPHATYDQMKDAAKALLHGDENRWGVVARGHQDQGPGVPSPRKGLSHGPPRSARTTMSATVDAVDVAVFTVPTDQPEADGTCSWDATTMVLVEVRSGTTTGLGWTYGAPAVGAVARDQLAGLVRGRDAMDVGGAFDTMVKAVRNAGRVGAVGYAISAVDVALWDLKARLLGLPLHRLLGAVRERVPVYGSGGFTTYDARPTRRPARRLGERAADPPRQDQDRAVLGHRDRARPGTDAPGPHGDRGRRRAVRGRQRCLHAQASSPGDEPRRRPGRPLVRGTRLLRRPGRAARGPRGGPGRRDRGRVRLRPRLLQADVRGRRRGLPAGRRVPLRRDHRVAARGRGRRVVRAGGVGALRPAPARARGRGHPQPAAPGVVPRPRADRDPVLRRDARADRRCAAPGSGRPGARADPAPHRRRPFRVG